MPSLWQSYERMEGCSDPQAGAADGRTAKVRSRCRRIVARTGIASSEPAAGMSVQVGDSSPPTVGAIQFQVARRRTTVGQSECCLSTTVESWVNASLWPHFRASSTPNAVDGWCSSPRGRASGPRAWAFGDQALNHFARAGYRVCRFERITQIAEASPDSAEGNPTPSGRWFQRGPCSSVVASSRHRMT